MHLNIKKNYRNILGEFQRWRNLCSKEQRQFFSQIEKSLYTAPAFINAVKAAVPDVTLQAMLTDEQKQQIAKGALKLMTKKDGSLMANLISPETKKIVATHNHPEGIKGA